MLVGIGLREQAMHTMKVREVKSMAIAILQPKQNVRMAGELGVLILGSGLTNTKYKLHLRFRWG
jgi:hypothetical protein